MKIYPQTFMETQFGAFYLNNKVKVHTFSLANFTSPTELKSSSPLITKVFCRTAPATPGKLLSLQPRVTTVYSSTNHLALSVILLYIWQAVSSDLCNVCWLTLPQIYSVNILPRNPLCHPYIKNSLKFFWPLHNENFCMQATFSKKDSNSQIFQEIIALLSNYSSSPVSNMIFLLSKLAV